jgi:glycosyltransferase involved in cell wall biosynthesis
LSVQLVIVSSWFPYPPTNGSKLRAWHLLNELAGRHEVTLLSFAESGEASPASLDVVRRVCREVTVVRGNPHKPVGRLRVRGLLSRMPRSYVQTYSFEMATALARSRSSADAAIGLQVGTALYLPAFEGWPRVFEEAEVGQVFGEPVATRGARVRHWLTCRKYGAFMRSLVRRCSRTTVVSRVERGALGTVGCDLSRVHVVPNGVDAAYLETSRPKVPDRLIYPGSLTFSANRDAVEHFLGEIWPLLKRERPGITFHVTGSYAGVDVERLPNRQGLVLTGHVADIVDSIARSSVCVVPLRRGGGTRLKILEAMALGTPVVSTSKGAEGLDVLDGVHLLVADRPDDFARAVLGVLEDPGRASALAANARRLVAEQYTWPRIAGLLDEVLHEAVDVERCRARRG